MLASLLEQLYYKNKGLILNDVNYRHSSGAVPTLINRGAGEQLTTASYVVMNNTIFALTASYTVPTGKKFNIMRIEIDATAVATDGDCMIAIYADSAAVMEFNIPQNLGHYEQSYPICREFVAGEVVAFYGKALDAAYDKTFNAVFWGLTTNT